MNSTSIKGLPATQASSSSAHAQILQDPGEDRPPFLGVGNRRCPRRQVSPHTAFQVEGKLRVGKQIGVPRAAARSAAQVNPLARPVKPDFDAARLAAFPPNGCDIDGAVAFNA